MVLATALFFFLSLIAWKNSSSMDTVGDALAG